MAILCLVFGLAWNWLDGFFPGWGAPMALGLVFLIMRKRLRPFADALRRWWLDKREGWMTRRGWVMVSGGATAAVALLVFPRFAVTVRSPVVLEPERRVYLSARAEGFVADVLRREGERVRRGERLAVLRNEELALLVQATGNRATLAESRARASRAEGRAAEALKAEREARELKERMEELRSQMSSLELRAPGDGVVLTPRVEDLLGTYRKAGEPVLELGLTRRMRATVRVSEWDIRWVRPGQSVSLHLDAFPFRPFSGKVHAVAPAASGRPVGVADGGTAEQGMASRRAAGEGRRGEWGADKGIVGEGLAGEGAPGEDSEELRPHRTFEAHVLLENPDGLLRPGMAGTAKIYSHPRSIAERALRVSADWVRSVVW